MPLTNVKLNIYDENGNWITNHQLDTTTLPMNTEKLTQESIDEVNSREKLSKWSYIVVYTFFNKDYNHFLINKSKLKN